MRSRTTPTFRRLLVRLPVQMRRQAVIAYRLFRENPFHPSLQFKRLSQSEPLYSVRITQDYRAVGLWENDEIRWVWIGSLADYDALLRRR